MEKQVSIQCGCGCSILKIESDDFGDGEEIIISHYELSFNVNQQKITNAIKDRIKRIWCAILGKEYQFYEIMLTGEDVIKFKKDMKDFIKSDRK